jgi:SAM-dependent methyltransferase
VDDGQTFPYPSLAVRARNGRVADHPEADSSDGDRYDLRMKKETYTSLGGSSWEALAQVYAESREVSADNLIEWPAQKMVVGDVSGKRVLDLGCGTGDKARYLADNGASRVIGIDASSGFAANWLGHANCSNLELVLGSLDSLPSVSQLQNGAFQLITSFQALMYATDLAKTIQVIASLLDDGGALVFSVPHPFRFAILRNEIEHWGHGFAYQQTEPYRYPSPWKVEVSLEHAMPRISDYLNAISLAGLRLTACVEPGVTDEFRQIAPDKAAWMDRYVGIIIFRAEKNG